MKKNWILVSVLAVLAFVGSIGVVKADNSNSGTQVKNGTDYSALAAKYDKLAADQDVIITEHETMKVAYTQQHAGMDKHCNAIIKDAKKLKADYVAFADWARLMAKETVK